MTADRSRRQRRIAKILSAQSGRPVLSQEELRDRLGRGGFSVTQATLSRDLRALGVMKGPGGYMLPGRGPGGGRGERAGAVPIDQGLRSSLGRGLVSVEAAGTLVVIRTEPGHASALALEIDRTPPKGAAGTVAGDDTIFVAARTAAGAKALARFFRESAGLR